MSRGDSLSIALHASSRIRDEFIFVSSTRNQPQIGQRVRFKGRSHPSCPAQHLEVPIVRRSARSHQQSRRHLSRIRTYRTNRSRRPMSRHLRLLPFGHPISRTPLERRSLPPDDSSTVHRVWADGNWDVIRGEPDHNEWSGLPDEQRCPRPNCLQGRDPRTLVNSSTPQASQIPFDRSVISRAATSNG